MNGSEPERIFEQCFEQVYAYIAYRTAPDRAAAEDITQEVFLAAFRSLEQFRGDCPVLTWLRGIARNKLADHFRAVQMRPSHVDDQLVAQLAADDGGLSERQDRALLVSLALRDLPVRYAELLEEKYLEGLAVKEIALRRNLHEKAVESALTRAREAFRQAWQKLQQHCS